MISIHEMRPRDRFAFWPPQARAVKVNPAMPTPAPQPPLPRWQLWTLLLILLLAVILRVRNIHAYDFWLDEFWTVELSTGRGSVHLDVPHDTILDPPPKTTQLADAPHWYTVWTGMDRVTHPPLYFLLLRIWRETFGPSDVAARMLSVTASLAALALLWDIARRTFGPPAAIAATLLFLVAWPQVEYAQQARNYAVLTALALGMLWPIVRMRQDGETGWTWPRGALLFAATLATLLTHYFAAGTVLAMFLAVLLCLRGRARTLGAAAMLLSGVVFLLAWGPWMWEQRHVFKTSDPTTTFLVDDAPGHLWRTTLRLAMQPGLLVAPLDKDTPARWLALAGIAVWVWPLISRRRRELLPAWLWMTGTIAVIALLDFTRGTKHLDFPRYTVLAGPGVYLLIAAAACSAPALASATRRWTGYALAATLVVVALMITVYTERKWRSFRHLAAAIDDAAVAGDVIVLASPGHDDEWAVGALYLGYNHYSDEPDHPVLLLRDRPTDDARDRLRRATRVWLIAESEAPPETILPGFTGIKGGVLNGYPAAIWLVR